MPSEASRKRYSTSAGKPGGVSCTAGRISWAIAIVAMNAAAASRVAFQLLVRLRRSRRMRVAAIAASTVIAIIARKSIVRLSIVSGLPTVGGFAGYFVNGIAVIVRNAAPARTADVAR